MMSDAGFACYRPVDFDDQGVTAGGTDLWGENWSNCASAASAIQDYYHQIEHQYSGDVQDHHLRQYNNYCGSRSDSISPIPSAHYRALSQGDICRISPPLPVRQPSSSSDPDSDKSPHQREPWTQNATVPVQQDLDDSNRTTSPPSCRFERLISNQDSQNIDPRLVSMQRRRVTANRKERRRTLSLNTAFADLRGCIPNVPPDTKLSKIKILRLATSYIAYLTEMLSSDNGYDFSEEGDGFQDIIRKIEEKEQERKKMVKRLRHTDENAGSGSKYRTRTGWPNHVWALELKKDS